MDTTDEPPRPTKKGQENKVRSDSDLAFGAHLQESSPTQSSTDERTSRCDEQQPSCTPCISAGVPCQTSKPSEKSTLAPVRRKTGVRLPDTGASSEPSFSRANSQSLSPISHTVYPVASTSTSSSLAHLLHAAELPTASSFNPHHTALPPPHMPTPARPAVQQPPQHRDKLDRFAESGYTHSVDQRRRFVGASSSQALLRWLDSASSGTQLADHLRYGLATTDEWLFAGLDDPCDHLPDNVTLHQHVNTFFKNTFPQYPFLDEAEVRKLIDGPRFSLTASTRALLYSLIAHSADSMEPPGTLSDEGTKYLELAWKSLPSILSRPYRVSLQALIMLTISLRTRERDGLAWTVGALALRIAVSFGMHLARGTGTDPEQMLEARIWYSAWAIDKVETLESGRQSSVDDRGCSIQPSAIGNSATLLIPGYPDPVDVFTPYVTLCYEVEAVFSWLFSSATEFKSKEDVLRKIGERDASLSRWLASVPSGLRPSNDPPAADALLPWTANLHLLYHNTLITLHRISLFDHATHVVPLLTKPALRPYAPRLQNSVSICLSSARSTLACLERLSSTVPFGKSWTWQPIFTAIVVIAVHTWQNPSTWQASADLGLLKHATSYGRDVLSRAGFPNAYVDMLPNLYQKTKDKVERPTEPSRAPTPPQQPLPSEGLSHSFAAGNNVTTNGQPGADAAPAQLTADEAGSEQLNMLGFGQAMGWDGRPVELDSLWPFLLGNGGFAGDNTDLFLLPAGQSVSGYHEMADLGPRRAMTMSVADLPHELLVRIFSFAAEPYQAASRLDGARSLAKCSGVCSAWHAAATDVTLWDTLSRNRYARIDVLPGTPDEARGLGYFKRRVLYDLKADEIARQCAQTATNRLELFAQMQNDPACSLYAHRLEEMRVADPDDFEEGMTQQYWAWSLARAVHAQVSIEIWTRIESGELKGNQAFELGVAAFSAFSSHSWNPLLVANCADAAASRINQWRDKSAEDLTSAADMAKQIRRWMHFVLRAWTEPGAEIPITLVSVFCSLATRCFSGELRVAPISFPGVFLVAVALPSDEAWTYYDVHGDECFTKEQALAKLRQVGHGDSPELLEPATPAECCLRVGRNILASVRAHLHHPNLDPSSLHLGLLGAAIANLLLQVEPIDQLTNLRWILSITQAEFPSMVNFIERQIYGRFPVQDLTAHYVASIKREDSADLVPKYKTPEIRRPVGWVFRHRLFHYIAVVRGWDATCEAGEEWIQAMQVDTLPFGRHQPFYHVITSTGHTRYVAQENITDELVGETHHIDLTGIRSVGRWFTRRAQDENGRWGFAKSVETATLYPDDPAAESDEDKTSNHESE
ncbi:hypothetical protein OIV83_002895 [Microbotryomycetes sp. JL201]|nr:hypothetical protein OIV83_002895 [Microbotryomycetes sp. JL201]